MLTRSPGLSSPRVVTARVWGMSMTENPSGQTSTRVRLTPSTAIDPLGTSSGVQAGSSVKARNSHSPSCRRSRRIGRGVDVPLDEMAAQAVADPERPLEVDAVAGSLVAQVGAEQGLRPRLDLEPLALGGHDGQAAAVDRHALADRQRLGPARARPGVNRLPAFSSTTRSTRPSTSTSPVNTLRTPPWSRIRAIAGSLQAGRGANRTS